MPVYSDGKIFGTLREIAHSQGAEIYELDIKQIELKQSIRLKCSIPLCEHYGTCKVCPPNIASIAEFKEALQSYEKAYLVIYREKIKNIEDYRTDFSAELRLAETIAAMESAALKLGCYQFLGLSVGGCRYCTSCTPSGEPCRHPSKARPSPTGFGIDTTELALKLDVLVEWPPVEYISFIGLVFI